jgi:hypothetical protein
MQLVYLVYKNEFFSIDIFTETMLIAKHQYRGATKSTKWISGCVTLDIFNDGECVSK